MDNELKNKFVYNFKKGIIFPIILCVLLLLVFKFIETDMGGMAIRLVVTIVSIFVLYALICMLMSTKGKTLDLSKLKPRKNVKKTAHVENASSEKEPQEKIKSVENVAPVQEEAQETVKKENATSASSEKEPLCSNKKVIPTPTPAESTTDDSEDIQVEEVPVVVPNETPKKKTSKKHPILDLNELKKKIPKFSEPAKPEFKIGDTHVDFESDNLDQTKIDKLQKVENIEDIDSSRLFEIAKNPETVTGAELKLITTNPEIKHRYETFLKNMSDNFDKNKNLYYLKRL